MKLTDEQKLPPGKYVVQFSEETSIVTSEDGRLMNTDYPLACSLLFYWVCQGAERVPLGENNVDE